jgi:hypothetical protein
MAVIDKGSLLECGQGNPDYLLLLAVCVGKLKLPSAITRIWGKIQNILCCYYVYYKLLFLVCLHYAYAELLILLLHACVQIQANLFPHFITHSILFSLNH